MKKISVRKARKEKTGMMIYMLIASFILSLTVGYTALNSEVTISGEATFRVEEDIRITGNVRCSSSK